jgi:ABC-2 type transport system permease protein
VRPAPAGALTASLVYGRRALLKIRHQPEQLTDVIFIPVLFTLMFTYLFGGALSGSTGDYLRFLLPGTLVMSIILVSAFTAVTLHHDFSSGAFDRLRSLPVWRPAHLAGALLGDAGRYLIASSIVIGLGLLMGYRPAGGVTGVLLALAVLLLFSSGLAWIWIVIALIARSPSAVSSISFLVTFPLTFASNVFVDPATMPGWLRAFVDANPVTHLVTTIRDLMAGTTPAGLGWVLLASAALIALFAPLSLHLYARKT